MEIIKEQTERHCVIRSDTYAKSLDHMLILFEFAQSDFPGLKPEDVSVQLYGGRRFKGTYGIEFPKIKIEGTTVPGDYRQISELESTL